MMNATILNSESRRSAEMSPVAKDARLRNDKSEKQDSQSEIGFGQVLESRIELNKSAEQKKGAADPATNPNAKNAETGGRSGSTQAAASVAAPAGLPAIALETATTLKAVTTLETATTLEAATTAMKAGSAETAPATATMGTTAPAGVDEAQAQAAPKAAAQARPDGTLPPATAADTAAADDGESSPQMRGETVLQGLEETLATNPTPESGPETPAAPAASVAPTITEPAAVSGEAMRIRLESMLASARSETPAPTQDQIDDLLGNRVSGQVARQLQTHLKQIGDVGVMKLSLTPPHLGRVEIHFTRQGDTLQVLFQTESVEAREALRNSASDLAQVIVSRDQSWRDVNIKVAGDDDEQSEADEEQSHRDRDNRDEDHRSESENRRKGGRE